MNPDRIPAGYTRTDLPADAPQGAVAAFTNSSSLVIVGYVDDEDDQHSCDRMGCGQDHVLERR